MAYFSGRANANAYCIFATLYKDSAQIRNHLKGTYDKGGSD